MQQDRYQKRLSCSRERAMIPKPSHPLTFVLPAAVVVFLIMGVLPLTHSLFKQSPFKKATLTPSQIVVNEVPLKKKKPAQPKSQYLRRTLPTSMGPTTTRKEQLLFTPDLSIGSEGGVAVENPELSAVIFEENEAEIPPKLLSHQSIHYPEQAREEGIEGVVELLIVVGREGTVEEIEFTKLPHQLFRRSISKQVSGWRFSPGQHSGVPVRVRVRQSFDFSLE